MKISKIIAAMTGAVLVSFASFGQETIEKPADGKMKTLLNASLFQLNKLNYIGVYIAPSFQYGQVDGSFEPMVGGSASVLFNKRLAIGIAGYTTLNYRPNNSLRLAYGGGKVEYTLLPNQVVHLSIPLLIGGGFASNTTNFDLGGRGRNGSSFFLLNQE